MSMGFVIDLREREVDQWLDKPLRGYCRREIRHTMNLHD